MINLKHSKECHPEKGRGHMKDRLCAYYTNSGDITSYMAKKLGVKKDDLILEPSAGEGIFIDEILKDHVPVKIDALDIDSSAVAMLREKYKNNPAVTVRETDTLLDAELDSFEISDLWTKREDPRSGEQPDRPGAAVGYYDKVIGNPPYGAWQDYDKRDLLKKKYFGQYVKETYSLFLLRCVAVLKMGGRLSFIIPDTYMFLNLHSRLREMLLSATKIEEIIIFPSKFFPGVRFGYSNLSVITLERAGKKEALNNTVSIIRGFRTSAEFECLTNHSALPEHLTGYQLKQADILRNGQHRFILTDDSLAKEIRNAPVRLGDIADVVTGFYTGDNRRFIRALNDSVRGAKNYEKIKDAPVYDCSSLQGIGDVTEGYVPYVKGASKTRYFKASDEWFVRWDREAIDYYYNNKRSRFQNSDFYFKTGIAVPMVKAGTVRAFLIQNRIFDQSIVGIFPKDSSRLYYILAIMNSDVINDMIHAINPTANNSANYIKQIPYMEPDNDTLEIIENKVKEAVKRIKNNDTDGYEELHSEINSLVSRVYGF